MKKILITAGIHGNELASILLAREMKGWTESKGLENVEVIPEVNKQAVKLNRRDHPGDGKNLNRTFPGRMDGSATERIAHRIFEKARKFDYVIDLHTYGSKRVAIPYVLTDLEKKYNREFARQIGLQYAVQTMRTPGELFLELSDRGKPAILIEMCGAEKIIERYMEKVKSAIKAFLTGSGEKEVRFFEEYEKIRPDRKGLFEPKKEAGESIKKGETIGYIDGKEVKTKFGGTVLGIQTKSEYNPDKDYVVSIARGQSFAGGSGDS